MSKVVDTQPNWLDIFVYGDLCSKLWTPQPNWLDIFVYGDLCPKLWSPCLTDVMCLFMMIFV